MTAVWHGTVANPRGQSGVGDECPLMENAPKGIRVGHPFFSLPFRFGFSNGTLGQGGSLGGSPVLTDLPLGTVDQRSSEETNR